NPAPVLKWRCIECSQRKRSLGCSIASPERVGFETLPKNGKTVEAHKILQIGTWCSRPNILQAFRSQIGSIALPDFKAGYIIKCGKDQEIGSRSQTIELALGQLDFRTKCKSAGGCSV